MTISATLKVEAIKATLEAIELTGEEKDAEEILELIRAMIGAGEKKA